MLPMGNIAADSPLTGVGDRLLGDSKEDVNYREGEPDRNCGTCVYFAGDEARACDIVEGEVSRGGICDKWEEATTDDYDDD